MGKMGNLMPFERVMGPNRHNKEDYGDLQPIARSMKPTWSHLDPWVPNENLSKPEALNGVVALGVAVDGSGVHGWSGMGVSFWVVLVFFESAEGLGARWGSEGAQLLVAIFWVSHHVPVSCPSGSPLFSGALCCASLG